MRGKLSPAPTPRGQYRNIPAYAGKTHVVVVAPQVVGGTSPRMRGKLCQASTRYIVTRNIPAYAGKTREYCSGYPAKPEHPRVCGENCASRRFACSNAGTSPRMRGKPLGGLGDLVRGGGTSPRMRGKPSGTARLLGLARNIPAYAGKTSPHGLDRRRSAEHPRVCGENKKRY